MSIHRVARIVAPVALALSLAACEDPTKDKPKAQVSSAAPVGSAPVVPGIIADLDTARSTVAFVGSKVTGKHEGKFEKVFGTVKLVDGKIEGGDVIVDLEAASLKTDQEKLDEHLRGPDFLDVQQFPKANFKSTSIKAGGEKGATHTVTGELSLHGVKKTLTFPATITVSPDEVTGTAEFSINRKDFGIVYAGKADDLIRDDVLLKLSLKTVRRKG